MKKYALNGIYLFVIFLPLIFIASLPTWLLNTGQGGELLSSIWQDRPMALTALIAFPYLFSMYTASASLLLKAVDTLPVTSDGEKSLPTVSRKQVVFASLIGAFGTLFSFMPMYSFQRIDAISSSMNEGFVSRWYYVCGAILLGLIGMGLCASYRLLHASGRKWLKFIFNPGIVYFSICSFIYINQVYFKAVSKASGYGDANREALVFFFFLVVVTCVIPGPRSLRDSTLTAEQGSRSLIKRIKFVRYEQRAMVLGILTLLLFAMFPAKVGLLLGSLLVLVAGLGAWSVLCGLVWPLLLRGKFRLPRLVTLTAITVWLAMCSSHTLVADRVNTKFSNNGSSATSSAGEVITISEDYVAWNKQSDAPTIIILAEGGGIRASYWTGLCLGMLSLPTVDLMSRTYAIIGVSGGSLGVASFMANYVAAEHVMQAKPYDFSKYSNPSGIAEGTTRNALNSDFLGPWMARVISTENIQKLIPFRLAPSKGETLQDAWRTALTCGADTNPNFPSSLEICALVEPMLNAPMASFPRKLGDRELPRMVFVSTHVETGERILFSSINYGHEKIYGAKFMEALAPGQVGLLSAAHSSARFPLVSPPGEIFYADGRSAGHVVDGGYDDNSGAQTAMDILKAISSEARENFHPIIIDLNNDPDEASSAAAKSLSNRNGGELLAIASTIENSRRVQGYLAKRQLLNQACDLGGGYVSLRVSKDRDGAIGLGWTLSASAETALLMAMHNETQFFFSAKPGMPTPAKAMEELFKQAKHNCTSDIDDFTTR